jgi:hypothetical protein
MLDDAGKHAQFRAVVEDLIEDEMRRLRAYAELVSQNTLYRGKRLEYTPRIGSVRTVRASDLMDEFLSRCTTEGYDIRAGSSYGRCVLRVHVVGRDKGKRDERDRGKDGAHEPHTGVECSGRKLGDGTEVLGGAPARLQVAKV